MSIVDLNSKLVPVCVRHLHAVVRPRLSHFYYLVVEELEKLRIVLDAPAVLAVDGVINLQSDKICVVLERSWQSGQLSHPC